ncbi:hypothetical protein BFJ63_vAg17201 [Fusarium oxysporum f. sp. narcissi]|uniref:Uncharacterized protein n=1 Tax=Fusarium oxysporum f. sp. narcissi TaxID=451672 RepID=A0A4Q2V1C9_FUSOX|nr:hypothetical protein BFJ63_vAg17201 [Fusarium oxysporum f. sp. narcissi]
MLNHGDDSAIPVPAIFMFVPAMPVVVNQNTHQSLKLVNWASYTALEVIIDKAFPGYRVSADVILHFRPPAGILLASEMTADFHFVGMPPWTILLTPMSIRIECQRKRPWQQHDVTRKGLRRPNKQTEYFLQLIRGTLEPEISIVTARVYVKAKLKEAKTVNQLIKFALGPTPTLGRRQSFRVLYDRYISLKTVSFDANSFRRLNLNRPVNLVRVRKLLFSFENYIYVVTD